MDRSIAEVLCGRQVETVKGGCQLVIQLAEGLTVRVGGDFRLAAPTQVEHFYPDLTLAPSRGLLDLIGRPVADARITLAGGLELCFGGGRVLSVAPDYGAEPWTVSGPDGQLFAALPGGYSS